MEFQYDYQTTHDYVWLVNESESCRTELHFRIEDTTGEGLTYNYENFAYAMEVCRHFLRQETPLLHESFCIETGNSVQHWEVRREGALPELSQKGLLGVFGNTVQCLLNGHPAHYQQESCWGALLCVSGKEHQRRIYDGDRGADFFLRLTVPVWTSVSDYTAFTSSLIWQGDVVQMYTMCAEGPLTLYAAATGLSSGRRDSLMQDFIGKVRVRHFVR